ncbi:MAG: hypothetical protein EOP04_28075 [Proteobacteria bacterium]|nr:MAG: hypothetical protein EOP04_28075 [Pseudomonadota bacterium]
MRKTNETPLDRTPASLAANADGTACVFSPNNDFIASFKGSNIKYSAVKTTSTTKPFMLTEYMKKKACLYGVYVVHGPKTATVLDKMSKELAQKLLIVNLGSPSLINDPSKFLNVVNLYFPHPEAGKRIAENLRALARPGSIAEVAHTDNH